MTTYITATTYPGRLIEVIDDTGGRLIKGRFVDSGQPIIIHSTHSMIYPSIIQDIKDTVHRLQSQLTLSI